MHIVIAIVPFLPNLLRCAHTSNLPRQNICKAFPNSSDWPSLQSWQSLNNSVSGNFLAPFPPGAVCDSSRPQVFDHNACARVGKNWFLSRFHTDDPVSVSYPNWQNDACLPTAVYNATGGCDLDPYPKYVVKATEAAHVAHAIRFAASTRVRLIVKGGAHDLLGR